MDTCENMIGMKACGHEAHASVFGVQMCSSCITRELRSFLAEKYIREVKIDPVTSMRSLIDAGVKYFVSKEKRSILSPIKLTGTCPKFTRSSVYKSKNRSGGPSEYQISAAGHGRIGRVVRDAERGLWLVVPKGGNSAVDAAGSVDTACRLLWHYHQKGELP